MLHVNVKYDHKLSDVSFSTHEVYKLLSRVDVNKAYGADNLSPHILKQCASQLSPSLAILFTLSMKTGKVPSQWKASNVVPIHKKGDKSVIENYRPVSLLSCVSKIMERCIFNHIYPIVEPSLTKAQHGFMKNKSCTTQLLDMYHMIGNVLDASGQVDIIYLDFSKAFDSVNHKLLLHKLQSFGLNGNLLSWFNSYLTDRIQRVVLEGHTSEWLPVLSGVPQGSILGPLLFILFINDMPSSCFSSKTGLFADDAKVFKKIANNLDCILLQADLDRLYEWSVTWKMNFNHSKCKILTVSRRKAPVCYKYMLNGNILEHVTSFKDLGVLVSSDLSWKGHINNIVSKCNRVNGMIKRVVGYHAPENVTLNLYKSLTRSIVEYSAPVWSPQNANELIQLESVQRQMTRFITKFDGRSYQDRCIDLNLLPLCYRREISDLVFFYKCLHDKTQLHIENYIQTFDVNTSLRSSDCGLLLKPLLTKTETFKKSFFNRIVSEWNSLPIHIRESASVDSLKHKLTLHYKIKLQESFNVNSMCTWTSTCRCQPCVCNRMKIMFL